MDLSTRLLRSEEYQDFSSIVEGNEHVIRELLRPIQFSQLSMEDREQLVYDKSNLCEFHDNLLKDTDTQFLYNTGNGQLYGACSCMYTMLSEGIFACWVYSECTFDKLTVPGLPANVTGGRLLWAHILNSCYVMGQGRPFIVFNHSIEDAVAYHLQMGMHPYSSSPIQHYFNPQRVKAIIDEIEGFEESYLSIGTTTPQLIADPKTTYLFYCSHPEINYGDIPSIINSLPPSARMGGKKSKKRRNKKSKRRNKKSKQINKK
jgi:hypothetical protein